RLALAVCLAACHDNAEVAGTRIGHLLSGDPTVTISGLPRLAETGGLSFEIVDEDTGERIPGKLTLVGVKGTHEPRLSRGDIGREEDNALAAYNRIFSLNGVGVVGVPTGTYDITASRGPEWTISTQR